VGVFGCAISLAGIAASTINIMGDLCMLDMRASKTSVRRVHLLAFSNCTAQPSVWQAERYLQYVTGHLAHALQASASFLCSICTVRMGREAVGALFVQCLLDADRPDDCGGVLGRGGQQTPAVRELNVPDLVAVRCQNLHDFAIHPYVTPRSPVGHTSVTRGSPVAKKSVLN
jgi:hypothetical protein